MKSQVGVFVLLLGACIVASPAALGASETSEASIINIENDSHSSLTVYRGDASTFDELTSYHSVQTSIEAGHLVESHEFYPGNTLAVEVQSSELVASISSAVGESPTDRFFSVWSQNTSVFELRRVAGPSDPKTVLQITRSNTRVIVDEYNETVFVLFDTSNTTQLGTYGGDELGYPIQGTYNVTIQPTPNETRMAETIQLLSPSPNVTSSLANLTLERDEPDRVESIPTKIPVRVETGLLPGKSVTVSAVTLDGTVLDRKRINTSSIGGGRSVGETTLHLENTSVDEFELIVVHDGEAIRRHSVFDGPPPILRNLTVRRVESGIAVSATVRVPDEGAFLIERIGRSDVTVSVPEDELVRRTVVLKESDFDNDGETRVTLLWTQASAQSADLTQVVFPSIGFRQVSLPEETETPTETVTRTQSETPESTLSETPSTMVGFSGLGLVSVSLATLSLLCCWRKFKD